MDEHTRADVNAVGDVVLTDPAAMRALADPFRLALHDQLRRRGPATVEQLAGRLRKQPRAVREHLEQMERAGLVQCRTREPQAETTWEAVGKGFVFEIPADPIGQAAARELSRAMFLHYADVPRRWANEVEPRLEVDWARAAGLLNARLLVTADELNELQAALERLIEPFLTRQADEGPGGAAHVRLLSYFMPEEGDDHRQGLG
jgi:DNA-binding transcriptional ArsR family regulator